MTDKTPDENIDGFSIKSFRNDLMHQLKLSYDIDWDYFVETAIRAQETANKLGINMTLNKIEERKDLE